MDSTPEDIQLLSSNGVSFFVHSNRLLDMSANSFAGLQSGRSNSLHLSEHSAVLELVLLAIYEHTCQGYRTTLANLDRAFEALVKYGVSPPAVCQADAPLYHIMCSQVSERPLAVYALASRYKLESVARYASSHLLSLPSDALNDETTAKIDPVYLKRLLLLHMDRISALKRLLTAIPAPHTPTASCNGNGHSQMVFAWKLVIAYISWSAKPDFSTTELAIVGASAEGEVPCPQCRLVLREHIHDLITQWSTVKAR